MSTQTLLLILLVWSIVGLFVAIKFGKAIHNSNQSEMAPPTKNSRAI